MGWMFSVYEYERVLTIFFSSPFIPGHHSNDWATHSPRQSVFFLPLAFIKNYSKNVYQPVIIWKTLLLFCVLWCLFCVVESWCVDMSRTVSCSAVDINVVWEKSPKVFIVVCTLAYSAAVTVMGNKYVLSVKFDYSCLSPNPTVMVYVLVTEKSRIALYCMYFAPILCNLGLQVKHFKFG